MFISHKIQLRFIVILYCFMSLNYFHQCEHLCVLKMSIQHLVYVVENADDIYGCLGMPVHLWNLNLAKSGGLFKFILLLVQVCLFTSRHALMDFMNMVVIFVDSLIASIQMFAEAQEHK